MIYNFSLSKLHENPLPSHTRELVEWCKKVRIVATTKGEGESKDLSASAILGTGTGPVIFGNSNFGKKGRIRILRNRLKVQTSIGPKWPVDLPANFEPRPAGKKFGSTASHKKMLGSSGVFIIVQLR